jgi:CRISPR-associated endonuclease/helicase Cas3
MATVLLTQTVNEPREFKLLFKKLTGYSPYPWQVRLLQSLSAGQPVRDLYIPTAGGKTGVIPVWLCTVIMQLREGTLRAPRRLYYAVDRRIVVDQSEIVARDLQTAIQQDGELLSLLSKHSLTEGLVVSVLRGQRVTEQEAIISDPSAFAVVVCTPDMLFSRLLFSAYGCSHRVTSREAGLVGQDAYLVLDEAHMSPAAANVLRFVSELQKQELKRSSEANPKPFAYTCMTATPRSLLDSSLHLGEEDLHQLSPKLKAHKAVKLTEVPDKEKLDSILRIIEQQSGWSRLIVYVEKPADAARLCNRLQKNYDVKLLTGTMRGLEKSRVVGNLSEFHQGATREGQHVLICTSAGEVGLNISCDFMITELTFAERLAQRFGRLNRWAEDKQSFGYILRFVKDRKKEEKEDDYQVAIEATISYLKSLPTQDGWMDLSTYTLYTNPIPAGAFGPEKPSLSLNEAMIAHLANTSAVSVPVDHFIRGSSFEYNVNIVVRKKQETDALLRMTYDELQEYVAAVAVWNDELLKDTATNLKKALSERGEMLFVSAGGEARRVDFDTVDPYKLAAGTLYISENLNLVNKQGMFDEHGGGEGDIFAQVQSNYRRFVRTEEGFLCLDTGETVEADTTRELVKTLGTADGLKFKVIFDVEGLVYAKQVESRRNVKMTLAAHTAKAQHVAEELLTILPLPMRGSVASAAHHHDDGKAHWLWQLASRGSSDGEPLAKVGYFDNPSMLEGMRHELVSVLCTAGLDDLAGWLILSHHGRCRPFFQQKSYDPDRPEQSAELNAKLPAVLEKLNEKFGYWGLAYLEALVRAIDINSE